MTVTSITVYLDSVSELIDEEFEFYVVGRLIERYPSARTRVCSRVGQTNVVANAGSTRVPDIELELQELCIGDWWDTFITQAAEEQPDPVTWRAEHTRRGY